ncbi:MAG: tetratricopeptide repeat protein, partial [Bryobacteraceae bacterium]
MRTQTRRQLKQDRFAATANDAVSWTVEHRDKLIWITVIAAVVLAIVLGGWWYMQSREASANEALAQAIATYNAPVGAAAQAPPGTKTFATAQERAKTAREQFRSVADKYGRTNAGKIARYFVGLTDIDLSDNQAAEQDLKQVAGSATGDVASLAKMALASLYRTEGKDQQAIQLYKEVADKPTNAAPKEVAELQMAETYEAKDPQNARI